MAATERAKIKLTLKKKGDAHKKPQTQVYSSGRDDVEHLDIQALRWIGDVEGLIVSHAHHCGGFGKVSSNGRCCDDLRPGALVDFKRQQFDADPTSIMLLNKETRVSIGTLDKLNSIWLSVLMDAEQVQVEGVIPEYIKYSVEAQAGGIPFVVKLSAYENRLSQFISAGSSTRDTWQHLAATFLPLRAGQYLPLAKPDDLESALLPKLLPSSAAS